MSSRRPHTREGEREHEEESEAEDVGDREDAEQEEKTLEIINEMRKNEALHNIAHKRYKMDHNSTIEMVAKKLKMSSKQVVEKVRYVKRQYKRSLKLLSNHKNSVTGRSGDGLDDLPAPEDLPPETARKLWKWFRQCDFLKESVHVKLNKKQSKVRAIQKKPNFDEYMGLSKPTASSSGASVSGQQITPADTSINAVGNSFSSTLSSFTQNDSLTVQTRNLSTQNSTSLATSDPVFFEPSSEQNIMTPSVERFPTYSDLEETEVRSTEFTESCYPSSDVFHHHAHAKKLPEKTSAKSSPFISKILHSTPVTHCRSPPIVDPSQVHNTDEPLHSNDLRNFLHTMINNYTQNYTNLTLLKLIQEMTTFLNKFDQNNK